MLPKPHERVRKVVDKHKAMIAKAEKWQPEQSQQQKQSSDHK